MPKIMQLSWAATHSKWRKHYRGRQFQSRKCLKSDREAFRQALAECKAWKAQVDAELQKQEKVSQTAEANSKKRRRVNRAAKKMVDLAKVFRSSKRAPHIYQRLLSGAKELRGNHDLLPHYESAPPKEVIELPNGARTACVNVGLPLIEPFAVQAMENQITARKVDQSKVLSVCKKEFVGDLECSPQRIYNLDLQVSRFVEWLGPNTTEAINEDTLPNYRRHLLANCGEQNTAKDYFQACKQFLTWCYERGRLAELPRNFRSKKLTIETQVKKIELWSKEQVKTILELPELLRLYLLFMLNCGAYQSDLSDLTENEVCWKEGRVIRKRSKTQDHEGVPTVNFKLWPEVFSLLKKYRAEAVVLTDKGERLVLLSSEGTPLVGLQTDNVRKSFQRWQKKEKIELPPLKQLRKTGAAALDDKFGRAYATHYLGHAPQGVTERHYLPPPLQPKFDKAITWLRSKLLD